MNIPKKVYLASAVLLFVGGGATAVALMSNKPKEVAIKHSAQVATATDQAEPTATEDESTAAPVQQPTQPIVTPDPAPTPEENKAKVMRKITDYASSKGWNENVVYAETSCFDRAITGGLGYGDYDALFDNSKFSLLNDYLSGKFMFDGAICKLTYINQ